MVALVTLIPGVAPAQNRRGIDQGRLEYRIAGEVVGSEDFIVEEVDGDLVWRSSSDFTVGETRVRMRLRAAYSQEDGRPVALREIESAIDVGEVAGGTIEIWGSFVGPESHLQVRHPLSSFDVKVLDVDSKTGYRPPPDLFALETNGGYALFSAVSAHALSHEGRAHELSLLIPTADKSDLDNVTSKLAVRPGERSGAARRLELTAEGQRWDVRVGGDGFRIEKVTFPAQQFEAVRVSDRANLQEADDPGAKKEEEQGRPHDAPFEVEVEDGVLSGTLRWPHGSSLTGTSGIPAALYLNEEGAQDRNENSGSKAGASLPAVLAEAFAARGIAFLRLDDPGVGESTGAYENRSLLDLVGDAAHAYRTLGATEGIDRRRVVIVGHGEGALIATLCAVEERLRPAALVLIGAASESLEAMMLERVSTRMRLDEGLPAEVIARRLRPRELLYEQLRRSRSWDDVIWIDDQAEDGRLAAELEDWRTSHPFEYIQQHFEQEPRAMALLASSQTLLVTGGKDIVSPSGHARELSRVLDQAGRKDHLLLVLPMLDHDLAAPGQHLADRGAADRIAGWAVKRFTR